MAGGLCKFYSIAGKKRPIHRQPLLVQYNTARQYTFINPQLYFTCDKNKNDKNK